MGEMDEIFLPSATVDIRGRPRCAWAEDGRWGIIRSKTDKPHKWKIVGRHGGIIASFGFRLLPWTSVDIRDVRGRKMEAGKLIDKRQKNALNGSN